MDALCTTEKAMPFSLALRSKSEWVVALENKVYTELIDLYETFQ